MKSLTIQLAAALAALAGCSSFPTPSEQYRCDTTADCESGRVCDRGFCVVSEVDGGPPIDSPEVPGFDCAIWTATPRHFTPCALPDPSSPLELSGAGTYVYDTTDGTLTDPGGATSTPPSTTVASGRVISVERVAIGAGATLRVTGASPLIIASWADLQVLGTIDAGSDAARSGAGANPAECGTHAATAGQDDNDGASGGGGGGYQAAGGRGGLGDEGNPGVGGGAVTAPLLLGGCAGNRGGHGSAQNGGAGGAGGGAIQLTAREAITISGRVLAGGAGGKGAGAGQCGGGGGGSGGMIGLEGASVTAQAGAILAANGGGGGQGSQNQLGGAGQPGGAGATRANGGTGGDSAIGGLGGAGATLAGGAGQNSTSYGGGGGGGAAGFITVKSPSQQLTGATLSPAATIIP